MMNKQLIRRMQLTTRNKNNFGIMSEYTERLNKKTVKN